MAATTMHAVNRKPVPRSAQRRSDGRSPRTTGRNVFMRLCGSSEGSRVARALAQKAVPPSALALHSRGSSWFRVEAISTSRAQKYHSHEVRADLRYVERRLNRSASARATCRVAGPECLGGALVGFTIGKEVPIGIEGDLDRRMPHEGLYLLRIVALLNPKGGAGVA